jgi:hypothetical protein|tara:strand:+ start:579 stop:974 length:396 start_codon:yes stop_codon:yes gene_type:complete
MKSLIRNSNQTKQGLDFTGIENGKIHPSDIDAVLEFNNEALILIEVKRVNNNIPTGQRLLLERICNSWHTEKSVVLFVTHDFKQDEKDIPLNECKVELCFYKNKWIKVNKTDLKIVLNKLGENWNINKLKL